MKKEAPPSLIKWTGSKRSQAASIAAFFPSPTQGSTYFEPFLGSGAVLFYGVQHFQKAVASDIYAPLIDLWNNVKKSPPDVIRQYTRDWEQLQTRFPDFFYDVRERFNRRPNGIDLLFLSRTCVNGIIRFNAEGKFNNSIHLSRRGMLPSRFSQIVQYWTQIIQNTDFRACDYQDILSFVKEGDFVYFDPPYANSHNRYINDLDIKRFIKFLETLNDRNIKWALSFDGTRGETDLSYEIPRNLYVYKTLLASGNSAVQKVLNSSVEPVQESLYLNYVPSERPHPVCYQEQPLLF